MVVSRQTAILTAFSAVESASILSMKLENFRGITSRGVPFRVKGSALRRGKTAWDFTDLLKITIGNILIAKGEEKQRTQTIVDGLVGMMTPSVQAKDPILGALFVSSSGVEYARVGDMNQRLKEIYSEESRTLALRLAEARHDEAGKESIPGRDTAGLVAMMLMRHQGEGTLTIIQIGLEVEILLERIIAFLERREPVLSVFDPASDKRTAAEKARDALLSFAARVPEVDPAVKPVAPVKKIDPVKS